MKPYQLNQMIIDDGFNSQEYVTADITYDRQNYSITFNKADLEIMNSWVFEDETSMPANLPDQLIDSLREVIKQRI
ncbi:hypothetical protein [Bacillus sp. Marseille-P3661]|uniref:hypothetical protein n=1 Tax=Bacillus sp. Marseille-P3661 TaxID=1936234 RepID=UPI000C83C918|nr:hypothetical protein [Bacillus sp. Marseille-P3661]